MDDECLHPCARCARLQKTCCQQAEILITGGDRRRIGAHLGTDDFWIDAAPDDPSYAEPDPDDPNWHRLTFDPSGRRRVLRRRPNGDCTFLGPSGCVLDEETRPLVCRLYPHAYTERGLDGESDHYCPTERLRSPDDPNATMLTILRMEPEAARRWHRMLYAELHADGELSSCTSA